MTFDILHFLNTYGTVIVALATIILVLIEVQRLVHNYRQEFREQREFLDRQQDRQIEALEQQKEESRLHTKILLEELRDNREQDTLGIEKRRLAESNLLLHHSLTLTKPSAEAGMETPFTVFRLPIENIGDGPVDILASLVSSRLLSSKYKIGIGLRSRDVEWEDYEAYFWNHADPAGLFAGISTTKNMVTSAKHFIRLAAHENATLRRIDAVNNEAMLRQRAPLYMMYRAFMVARGYPLGEILRQLGGGPPDPLANVDQQQLQFRSLAQPNFNCWGRVQQAILNLNRLAFRLATGESDPLGRLVEPDAWRIFLLYHEDFIAPLDTPSGNMTSEAVAQLVWEQFYPSRVLPRDFGHDAAYQAACTFSRDHLVTMIAAWDKLNTIIDQCRDFDLARGYPTAIFDTVTPLKKHYSRDGYPVRVHTDREMRARWLKLLREGYLIGRPFPRPEKKALYDNHQILEEDLYDEYDIPDDPRVLEPFVMRTHYFLSTLEIAGD